MRWDCVGCGGVPGVLGAWGYECFDHSFSILWVDSSWWLQVSVVESEEWLSSPQFKPYDVFMVLSNIYASFDQLLNPKVRVIAVPFGF